MVIQLLLRCIINTLKSVALTVKRLGLNKHQTVLKLIFSLSQSWFNTRSWWECGENIAETLISTPIGDCWMPDSRFSFLFTDIIATSFLIRFYSKLCKLNAIIITHSATGALVRSNHAVGQAGLVCTGYSSSSQWCSFGVLLISSQD